ncbi:hypothetical protein DFS33DRAFT_1279179 [Desarmillaria ectypa]|nr:hypothetical protein DFS33DRAFT_1279179 [Desarmillaria ectypa]
MCCHRSTFWVFVTLVLTTLYSALHAVCDVSIGFVILNGVSPILGDELPLAKRPTQPSCDNVVAADSTEEKRATVVKTPRRRIAKKFKGREEI